MTCYIRNALPWGRKSYQMVGEAWNIDGICWGFGPLSLLVIARCMNQHCFCLIAWRNEKKKKKQQEGLDEEEQHACEHFQRKLFLYTFWLVNFDWTFLLYNPRFSFSSVTIDCAGPWLTEHLMLMLLKRYCRWKIKLISPSYSGTPL